LCSLRFVPPLVVRQGARRRHSDDLHRAAVDDDRLPNRGLDATEVCLCPAMPHHDDIWHCVTRRNVSLRQQAPRRSCLAEDRKEIGRDVPGVGKHGAVADHGCEIVSTRGHSHLVEYVVLRLPVEKVGP
jgi:hypothetical protein